MNAARLHPENSEGRSVSVRRIGFQVPARSRGVKYPTVPYRDWHYDPAVLAAQINEYTRIVYLANPSNPTGATFTRHEFEDFYQHVPERVRIILDEAYFEYVKDNPRYPDSTHYRYYNVITPRMFSKVCGLAGMRIGYGFAYRELISNLLKLAFERSAPVQAAGIAALADREFLHHSLELNARGLRFLTSALEEMGFTVAPSDANFVMVALESTACAERVFEQLPALGIIVRPVGDLGLPQCLGVGLDEQNQRLADGFAGLRTETMA